MGFESWIVVLFLVAGLSGWLGYVWASRRAPRPEELEALTAQLEAARQKADTVQAGVNEHFEQSARLFGKLAGDYREFLEHFAGSAQALGLSESRTRELVEQSFQPLLTHDVEDLVVPGEAAAPVSTPSAGMATDAEVTADEDSVRSAESATDAGTTGESPDEAAEPPRVAEVVLTDQVAPGSEESPESSTGRSRADA